MKIKHSQLSFSKSSEVDCKCERDEDKQRTAILILIFPLATLCHIQGPHLALLLLVDWDAPSCMAPNVTDHWLCDYKSDVRARQCYWPLLLWVSGYMISQRSSILSVVFLGCQPMWAAYTHVLLSSCLHSLNILLQDSLIDDSVNGQYATQDSSQYSSWSQQCCDLDGFDSSSDFQLHQPFFQAFADCFKSLNYNWYHCHAQVPHLFSSQARSRYFSCWLILSLAFWQGLGDLLLSQNPWEFNAPHFSRINSSFYM